MCEETGHRASTCSKQTAYLKGKGRNSIGTFDVCALEDVEESKNETNTSASKLTMVPARVHAAEITMKCKEIKARLEDSAEQRNEAHEECGS